MPSLASDPPRRRLTREARRAQLLAAALPVVARHGFADFPLEALSARAGVTRNLLYHYFPRGRADVVLAAVREAQRQLSGDALTRERIHPPAGGTDAFPSLLIDHALAPTHAWRIYRLARTAPDPGIRAAAEHVADAVLTGLGDGLGIREPSPLTNLALRGYLAFAESVLDDARVAGVPRPEVVRLLGDALAAIATSGR